MTEVRHVALVASVVVLLLACGSLEGPRALGPTPSATPLRLPQPIPQPITRTAPASQVAWLWTYTGQTRSLIAVDPSGALVAHFEDSVLAGRTGYWRSADRASVFLASSSDIASYSALDGKLQRTYSKPPGVVVGAAFSPDGHWLAMLSSGPDPRLHVIDLRAGTTQTLPVAHDPNGAFPGLSGQTAAAFWATLVFAADSTRLYTLTDWGGPARITAFSLAADKLTQTATAVDGQSGRRYPSCGGPAAAVTVSAPAQALVVFCHVDGGVWFFDLASIGGISVVQADQPNPFWLSPIFTPDGQLLYLHQWPAFGDKVQVIDLSLRKLIGPLATPTRLGDPGPFSWGIPVAYAGGTASTVPISPDGLKLYSGTDDGVMVLRVPDLKPLAKLAPGVKVNEVWVSGDGRTLYATADDNKHLVVIHENGTGVQSVSTPNLVGGFIASERG